MTGTPYDPTTPLRADATDDDIEAREEYLCAKHGPGPRRRANGTLCYACAHTAREYAAACVAAARASAPSGESPSEPGYMSRNDKRLFDEMSRADARELWEIRKHPAPNVPAVFVRRVGAGAGGPLIECADGDPINFADSKKLAERVCALLRAVPSPENPLNFSFEEMRGALAEQMKLRADLETLIGQPPEGSHPDEWKPRAETWHAERLNWIGEVEALRVHIESLRVSANVAVQVAAELRVAATRVPAPEEQALWRLRDTIYIHLGTDDPQQVAQWIAEARHLARQSSAPVVTREQVKTVQRAAGLIQSLSDALVALGDRLGHPYPQQARDAERDMIDALRELADVLARVDARLHA